MLKIEGEHPNPKIEKILRFIDQLDFDMYELIQDDSFEELDPKLRKFLYHAEGIVQKLYTESCEAWDAEE